MDRVNDTYHRVLRFIETNLHVHLTEQQKLNLKYLLDDEVQHHLQQLYEKNQTE